MAFDKTNIDEATRKQNKQLVKILRNLSDVIEEGIDIKKGAVTIKSVESEGNYVGLAKFSIELLTFEEPETQKTILEKVQQERNDEVEEIIRTLDKQLVKRKAKELEQIQKRYKLIEDAMKEPNDDYNKAWRVQYILDGKMDEEG